MLLSPGSQALGLFGTAVARTGEFVAVGAPESPDVEGGAVVYRTTPEGWVTQTILSSGVVQGNNRFGTTVAADGCVLAVGDLGWDILDGAVYVYRLTNGSFTFERQLTSFAPDPGGRFGWWLAIDGEVLVVGAPDADIPGCKNGGAAYVFRFDGTSWAEETQLIPVGCGTFQGFGGAVATANGVILVGDNVHNGPNGDTGAVFTFRDENGRWQPEQMLKPSDAVPGGWNHWFGWSVALDDAGDTAVIGATQNLQQAGSAYVFEYDGTEWVETAKLTGNPPFPFAEFGYSVDISNDGNTILVGARTDWEQGYESGGAHFFRRVGGEWIEELKFMKPGSFCLGYSALLDGDLALIGDRCANKVYVLAGVQGIDCNSNGQPDSCDISVGGSKDANSDGIPDECPIVGDMNGDGLVAIVDFLSLLGSWGACLTTCPPSCPGDFDGDCAVGITDFLLLLAGWTVSTTPPICPGTGDCCAPHASGGCEDPACCETACVADPFCCEVAWDTICVNEAQALCACPPAKGCGSPGASQCCAFAAPGSPGPGCSDAQCCETICDYVDPFCCQVQWDASCTAWAFELCASCPPTECNPDAGPCCEAHGGVGCNDLECCTLICEEIDPFCCAAAWDNICASEAGAFCKICGGQLPGS